jgi:hypothetical protein
LTTAICICPIPRPNASGGCFWCGGRLRCVAVEPEANRLLLEVAAFKNRNDELSERQSEIVRQQRHRHDQ